MVKRAYGIFLLARVPVNPSKRNQFSVVLEVRQKGFSSMNQLRAQFLSTVFAIMVLGTFVWLVFEYWTFRQDVLAQRASEQQVALEEDDYREAMLKEQLAQVQRYVPPAPIIDPPL